MLSFVAKASYKTQISRSEDQCNSINATDTQFIFHIDGGLSRRQRVKERESRLGEVKGSWNRMMWNSGS